MDIAALAGCWSRRQVSDWIDFGGNAPYSYTDDDREKIAAWKITAWKIAAWKICDTAARGGRQRR
jgi:hypothetical protein